MVNISGRVKMIDIAQRAKVSRMAVSHVLMGTGKGYIRVSPRTAKRIRKIAQDLGYTPNRAAQQLAGKRSGLLGVMVNDWMQPPDLRILPWVHQLATQRGYRVLVSQTNQSVENVKQQLADYAGHGIDGLIFADYGNNFSRDLPLNTYNVKQPFISVLGRPKFSSGCFVDLDYGEGVRQVVSHLHQQGRQHIVQFLRDDKSPMNRMRAEAFEQAHRHFQRKYKSTQLRLITQSRKAGEPDDASMIDELISEQKVDAIIADSDSGAMRIIRALHRNGLHVPNDIAVVGWGNEDFSSLSDPSLTTIDFRLPEVIDKAINILVTWIENPDQVAIHPVVLEPSFLVRESA
jgi:DNA-binding LacI/PurR family transcriptional regulator